MKQTDMDEFDGIPRFGPARKALLAAAGIKTRAALAKMTIEQIISVTGMPRPQVEKAMPFIQAEPPAPASTEAAPDAGDFPSSPALMPDEPEAASTTDLDGAISKVTAALADASRLLPKSANLKRPLTWIGVLIERLTRRMVKLGAKRQAKLAKRLASLAKELDRSASSAETMKSKQAKKLRDLLKAERAAIRDLIAPKGRK